MTVFFNPRTRFPAPEVFEGLQEAQIDHNSVSCIQRQSSSEIVLTFRNAHAKEQFLAHNVVKIRDQPFALQDIDRLLTYLQIFDAPHEMPDATIIQRLSKYCDVLHHRRGYFRQPGREHVQDSVCHYHIRIKTHILNFIRFGKLLVHFCYEGQPRTCRHCHQRGHYVNACHTIVCYNCEETGHLASDIPTEILCDICKQPDNALKSALSHGHARLKPLKSMTHRVRKTTCLNFRTRLMQICLSQSRRTINFSLWNLWTKLWMSFHRLESLWINLHLLKPSSFLLTPISLLRQHRNHNVQNLFHSDHLHKFRPRLFHQEPPPSPFWSLERLVMILVRTMTIL